MSRVIAGLALLVIGACGLTWVLAERPDRTVSLMGRPTWQLAGALPSAADFPADWGYTLAGNLGRVTALPVPAPQPPADPDSYRPAECGQFPSIDQMPGQALGSTAAASVDVNLPGENYQLGHKAHFNLYAVDDPGALIGEYTDWVVRCTSYRNVAVNPSTGGIEYRDVTQVADTRLPDGVDFGVSVNGSRMYYAVRGVVLQVWTNLEGADQALIADLAARTARKLRAL